MQLNQLNGYKIPIRLSLKSKTQQLVRLVAVELMYINTHARTKTSRTFRPQFTLYIHQEIKMLTDTEEKALTEPSPDDLSENGWRLRDLNLGKLSIWISKNNKRTLL